MSTKDAGPPRVHRNQWGVLQPATPAGLEPQLSVSVVIPAFRAAATLPLTLASLARQTYPSELLEVIVVDDGGTGEEPVSLPLLRPEHTRVVRTERSWGRAHACAVGAEAATGDVLHWLDADMVALPDEVAAQARWHHLLDHVVVLGQKTFVDPAEGLPTAEQVAAAAEQGGAALDALFADRWTSPHTWVEEYLAETNQLRFSKFRAYRAHTGATASLTRSLYRRAGGMDEAMKLGEDIELGYRLQTAGAVFVPDEAARSWHLGRNAVMDRAEETNRYNNAFFADRVPDLRYVRRNTGRSWRVPYVDCVVEAGGASYEAVRFTVDRLLGGSPQDVRVRLVGDWDRLDDVRRSPLADPAADLRMLAEEYAGEQRVQLVAREPEPLAGTGFPATFRLQVPAGWGPGDEALLALVNRCQADGLGFARLLLPDGEVVRLERVAVLERARRLTAADPKPPEGHRLDDLLDELAGSWWGEGGEEGWSPLAEAPPRDDSPEPVAGRRR